ncbi:MULTISPECIES: helix-turn-helix domain-containing protein [unclassified Serratia (in: enterobacteria)]|uniref:winged helix-turn-helix domain-containing protein n=1 Tax=unclassified Serratia (in: enterobacteria) TaxID=2647522 RepID=UPI0006913B30|nr:MULTISPECIES: helix-turn-helix domain-containing protein [unclassified Serratia (in: enterobacteria)]
MDNRLYGFLLDDVILFSISNRKLFYYIDEPSEHSMFFKAVSLNETQSRLLIFLLINSQNVVIDKNDIMKNVWDEFSLSSSNQRLWQTINELRKKLSSIGLPDDFIGNVHGVGYSIGSSKVNFLHII